MIYENFEMLKSAFEQNIYTDWANWCNDFGQYYIEDMGDKYITRKMPEPIEPTYVEKRAAEYPVYQEYLDAQVKINSNDVELISQGQLQLAKYYDDCLAVKHKYPKI